MEAFPNCLQYSISSQEDTYLGKCLHGVGITPNNTADALGRQRFHGTGPNFVATFDGTKGGFKSLYDLWGQMNNGFKAKGDLVSTQTLAFHWLGTAQKLKRHHAILYKSCPMGTTLYNYFFNQTQTSELGALET